MLAAATMLGDSGSRGDSGDLDAREAPSRASFKAEANTSTLPASMR